MILNRKEDVNRMVKIEFSNHAKFKLKGRNIDESEVMSVLKTPLTTFLDIETGNMMAIGNRTIKSDHKLIVAYVAILLRL